MAQLMNSGKFRYYNYGKKRNRLLYGQEEPPFIDISEIVDVPIAMFVGSHDSLANIIDNRWVKD
jgi:hypothetical protein